MKAVSGNKYKALGIMSGTSLDGMDLCAVEFTFNTQWSFEIAAAETKAYAKTWENKLRQAPLLSGEKLTQLHVDFGKLTAQNVNRFIQKTGFTPDILASHGHTVFHQPDKGFTFQIGDGNSISAETNITTVADFRTMDVALGGQGAPLVPVGDRLLFSEYEYCLNLGGFSNISFEENGQRIAFDICPVNIVLNVFANKKGLPFDKDGNLSKAGNVNSELLYHLNALPYYSQKHPKSLGKEWVDEVFFPVVDNSKISDTDKLRTIYEHIAHQIAKIGKKGKLLVTGGGAFNTFLLERISEHSAMEIVVPDKNTVNFKEALIFAFLGVLKIRNEINCLSSVTGAKRDSSTGVIFTT